MNGNLSSSQQLRLLPKAAAAPTSPVDHPDWNYHSVLSRVQRTRFRIICRLLGQEHFGRLLEIGFGSGVFMPELAARCDELYGIDPHPYTGRVATTLAAHGVHAELVRSGAEELPFAEGFFDCVVAVSTLEYVTDIDAACREIRRVLAPGGNLVLVTPGTSPVWNVALRLLTSQGPAQYGDRRQRLRAALDAHFQTVDQVRVPSMGGNLIRLYTGLRLRPVR